ncbi:hypothetical protein [Thermoanaerobacterium butyriciformans]|uniref:Ribosomal protein L32 n=1 Tax=Thermoanaerobacterium butyriciformans TaxID=1702242 RepID=A0ABS4NCQ4_9THEO|nr:hypothetical protein [Thermoanaerobacterium butyriciformans]MBP2070765.1 ribosomal protein L32 [Thermoanaerobacterium butyriciformans]
MANIQTNSQKQKQTRTQNSLATCPDCGAKLVPESGCMYCPFCGWSQCK